MTDFDPTGSLPFDRDAGPQPGVLAEAGPFLYDGRGFTAELFERYVAAYNFGRIPPDQIILHHTAIPSASWARYPNGAVWDANERGLSDGQIHTKRKKQLDTLASYYHDTLGWTAGPHLFIDERLIWTFTPMSAVGIHAKEGNSYYDQNKRLHYSIGIEVIGYYEKVPWPEHVAKNVRAAVNALSKRLSIRINYTKAPARRPDLHAGELSSHRDYNKPGCPGAAITEAFYLTTIKSPPVRTVKAGPRGAIAQQDRRPDAPTAGVWYPPGSWIAVDDLTSGYWHALDGIGFIPRGQVEE